MRRLLRLAFSLLTFAVPLQSMAAVAMVDCMAPAAGPAGHEHADHPAHHDDADAAAEPATHAPAGTHCASCGVAAMLPSQVAADPGAVAPAHYTAASRPGAPPFLTDGPDRPPRTDLD